MIRRTFLASLLCLFLAPAFASEPPIYVLFRVKEVVDADTLKGDVVFSWKTILEDRTVRACDYDAWECTKRRKAVVVTDEECRKGKVAKRELKALIERGSAVYLIEAKGRSTDNYGRLLAKIYVKVPGEEKLVHLKTWAETNNYVRSK